MSSSFNDGIEACIRHLRNRSIKDESVHLPELIRIGTLICELENLKMQTPRDKAIAERKANGENVIRCKVCHIGSWNVEPWCGRKDCPGRAS